MGIVRLNDTELFYDAREVAMIYQYLYDLGCKFSSSSGFQDSLRRTDITQLIAVVLEKARTNDNSEFSKIEYASRGLVFAVMIKTHQLASDTRKQWSQQVYGNTSQGKHMSTYRDHVLQSKETMLEYIGMLERDPPARLRIPQENFESVYEKSRQTIETMDLQGNMFWHELNTYFGNEESAWSQVEAGEHLRYRRNLFTKLWRNFDSKGDISNFSEWKQGVDSNLSEFEIDSSDEDGYDAIESMIIKDEIPEEIITISDGTELELKQQEMPHTTSTPIHMLTPSLTPIYVSKYARKRRTNQAGTGSPRSKRLSGAIKRDDMSGLQIQSDNPPSVDSKPDIGLRPTSTGRTTEANSLTQILFKAQTTETIPGQLQVPQAGNFPTHSPIQTAFDASYEGPDLSNKDSGPGSGNVSEHAALEQTEDTAYAFVHTEPYDAADPDAYGVPEIENVTRANSPSVVTTVRASALPKEGVVRRRVYRTRARLERKSTEQLAKDRNLRIGPVSLGTETKTALRDSNEMHDEMVQHNSLHRHSPASEGYHSENQDYGGSVNNDILDATPILNKVGQAIEEGVNYKSPTDEAILDDDFTEFLNTEYLTTNRLYENVADLSIDEVIRGSDQEQRRYSDLGVDINRPDNRPRTEGKQEYDNDFTLPDIEEHTDLVNYHNRPQFTSDDSRESLASVNEAVYRWMSSNDTLTTSIDECYKMLPFTETSHKFTEKDLFFAMVMGNDRYIEPAQETVSYMCPIQVRRT